MAAGAGKTAWRLARGASNSAAGQRAQFLPVVVSGSVQLLVQAIGDRLEPLPFQADAVSPAKRQSRPRGKKPNSYAQP